MKFNVKYFDSNSDLPQITQESLKNRYMNKVFYILFVALIIVTTKSKGQSIEIKNNHNMKKQILIDKFFIPKNCIEEFTQRMNYNRNFIKNLPGFVNDEVYEQADDAGNLTIITVAVWKNQDSLSNAKDAVQVEYKRIGFDPAEFYRRLNIKMERGLYHELQY